MSSNHDVKFFSVKSVAQLDNFLRLVHTRTMNLPKHQRIDILKLCILYKSQRADMAVGKIVKLLAGRYSLQPNLQKSNSIATPKNPNILSVGKNTKNRQLEAPAKQNINTAGVCETVREYDNKTSVAEALLIDLLKVLCKNTDKENRISQSFIYDNNGEYVKNITQSLKIIVDKRCGNKISIADLITRENQLQNKNDKAIDAATYSIIDRIMCSLDPELFIRVVEKNKFRTKRSYKAELFDLIAAKFKQIRQYHQQGRFIKDCKAKYRSELKKNGC